MKILIVDDSTIIRKIIKTFLKKDFPDFEIVGEATDGKQAIEMFWECNPDLVTMDINMPEMDGLRCLYEMLKINKTVKVVMLSALTSKETVDEAINKGAKGFIFKPFTSDNFKKTIETIVNKQD